jgi:hypothetical protein
MAEVIPDESIVSWAAGVAARLKLLQAGCADDRPAVRREEIAKVIQRALQKLPAAKRKPSLELLSQRFPSAVAAAVTPKPEAKATLDKVWTDLQMLPAAEKQAIGERLVADGTVKAAPVASPPPTLQTIWSSFEALPEQDRRSFLGRLIERGMIEVEAADSSNAVGEELRTLVDLPEGHVTSTAILEKVLFLLLRVKFELDRVLWLSWEGLAPAGNIRKPLDFERLVRDTLSEPNAAAATKHLEQMANYLNTAKELASTMLSAVGPAGASYGRWFGQTLSPTAIKQAVPQGGLMRWGTYWDKYQQLYEANVNSPEMIRKRILDAYTRAVERMLLTRNPAP